MVNNPRGQFLLVLALLAGAVSFFLWKGINLGLDLQGGSRLVYRFDFDDARRRGQIGEQEDDALVLSQTVQIFSKRVDSIGLREIPITTLGDDQVVIELPGMTPVEVDQVKQTITNLGKLSFRILADSTDDLGLDDELKKYQAWRTANPDLPTGDFNLLRNTAEGPRPELAWHGIDPESDDQGMGARQFGVETLDGIACIDQAVFREQTDPTDSWGFTGEELDLVGPGLDSLGFPAVRFEFAEHRKAAFADFTDHYVKRPMAIILNDLVYSAPNIQGRLPGGGIITGGTGGFSIEEMNGLITVLRTGSLKVLPELQSENTIGPSLGADSIRIGQWSAMTGLGVVLLFMILYYRTAGIIAAFSLALNLALLMGALAFSQATLTLPGIAGIVLTVGMAVDANILIFERIREERDRGRDVQHAVKNGFERAFWTIIDANLTTLITALILLKVGTGPIRGFAATLSWGIVTSLFAALVFSKVVFHVLVFSKKTAPKEISMMRILKKTTAIGFLGLRRAAAAFSLLLIVGGLFLFSRSGESLMGIDFTGGAMARVRLAQPHSIDEVRSLVGEGLAEEGLENASITLVSRDGADDATMSDEFVVRTKLTAEERSRLRNQHTGTESENYFATKLGSIFGDRLAAEDPFPEATTVGPRVVEDIRDKAILAIFFSLIAIVIYMNFRFKEYRYGIAAVVAIFHDVLITLGAVALVDQLGLVDVEIDLPILAAFLTIIGYSLNDTIVVFDRIRENLERSKEGFVKTINHSINQTLSRTILTSLTTLFVVSVLFVANRGQHNLLEGFSFALMVGVLVGTYSSIFVASPLLVFLDRFARKHRVETSGS